MDGRRKRLTPLGAVVACGRDFCMQTSIHGFIHVAAPGRWWGERLVWACATAVAIWGAVEISLGQWQRYNESPTVVALEKDFRSWEFCFPGFTLCTHNRVDEKKLPSVIKKYWAVDPPDEKYERYERFVRDVANSSLLHLADFLQHDGEDLEVDLYQLAVDVLPEFNLKATWSMASQVPWVPVMSEVGACYATNSLAIPDDAIVKPGVNETKMFPLTCKYSSLNCYSTIEIPEATIIYVHSPYDILNVRASPFEVKPGEEKATELSVMESACGRGVRDLPPRRRRCLYTDEPLAPGREMCKEEKATELRVMESACGRGVRDLPPRRRRCLYTDEPLAPGRKICKEEKATELSVMESACGRGVRDLPPRRRRCLYTDEPLALERKMCKEEKATELSVMESACGRGVRDLPPRRRRRCLYTDEPLAPGRQVYSTNTCRRTCRNQEALRDCQCKPFYNHYEDGVACSLQGMRCLAARAAHEAARTDEATRAKAAKRARKSAPTGAGVGDAGVTTDAKSEDCSCPLMCVDALFETLTLVTKPLGGPFGSNGVSRVKVQAPRTRYTREIVFYFQDLIVSFGGAAGLFLGASFISFVELLFFGAERVLGVLGFSAPSAPPVRVKKMKLSLEQTQIQQLNTILEDHRLPATIEHSASYSSYI